MNIDPVLMLPKLKLQGTVHKSRNKCYSAYTNSLLHKNVISTQIITLHILVTHLIFSLAPQTYTSYTLRDLFYLI